MLRMLTPIDASRNKLASAFKSFTVCLSGWASGCLSSQPINEARVAEITPGVFRHLDPVPHSSHYGHVFVIGFWVGAVQCSRVSVHILVSSNHFYTAYFKLCFLLSVSPNRWGIRHFTERLPSLMLLARWPLSSTIKFGHSWMEQSTRHSN